MREKLIEFLKKNIEFDLDFDKLVEKPKLENQGDFSLPMFLLAKEQGKNPAVIAKEYEEMLKDKIPDFIERVTAIGPFLNFYLDNSKVAKDILSLIVSNKIFKMKMKDTQKILIEYPAPNTNKALHVGHVRNILLGNSISKIFSKVGHNVVKVNLNNDRGIAICKAMLAYKMFGDDKTPKSLGIKPDKFVGGFYELFGKKNDENPKLKLEEKAQEMLAKWEAGDKEIIDLWKKVMRWVFEGYSQTYKSFKYECEKEFFESQIYDKGKNIVTKALKSGVEGFKIDDENGAVYVDLENKGYGKKYLLRGDGTTLYMTQDLYLAYLKEKEFKCDKYIFIVGAEQKYHFDVLFEILDRIGFGGLNKNYHFAFGMLYNKNGKKFSSRKGEVIDADELLLTIEEKALENLKEKSAELSSEEMSRRKKIIGYSALAFGILKINALDNHNFDIDKSLEMTGETGPYVQYTYARIKSVLRKAKGNRDKGIEIREINYKVFGDSESSLIKLLGEYPRVVEESALKYKPSHIANYLIKVCQAYNEFYQNSQILKEREDVKKARLLLCDATSRIIQDGLDLLDIEILEEM